MCRHGYHNYGPLEEIMRDNRVVVVKLCTACTFILYKDEWEQIVKENTWKRTTNVAVVTQHIDLFWD